MALIELVKKHESKIRVWEPRNLRQVMRYRGWFRLERWDGARIAETSTDYKHSANHASFQRGSDILYVGDEALVSLTPRALKHIDRSSKVEPSPEQKYVNKRNLSPALQKIKDRKSKQK